MTLKQLINLLNFDEFKFEQYMKLQSIIKNFNLPSLEQILLDKNELAKFCLNQENYEKLFLKNIDSNYHEYVSYLAFCRKYNLYPYIEDDKNRNCSNCAYSKNDELGNIICVDDYVYPDSVCEEHTFSVKHI